MIVMDRDDLPEFDPLHYTQQDYLSWHHINRISEYLPRKSISSLAEAKALMNFKDDRGRCPIHLAIENNDVDALESFLALACDVNQTDVSGKTPIYYAVAAGNREMINILIQKGANTNVQDEEGDCLLHVAATYCKLGALEDILEKTVYKIDSRDKYQWTPLHKSAWYGCVDVARLLLEKGANVDALTDTKNSPLIIAVGRKHHDVADILLRNGANPNIKPNNGWTALHRAAESEDADAAKLLIFYGADMYVTDNMGRTPMHLAIERNSVGPIQIFTMNGYRLSKKDYTSYEGPIDFM